MYEISDIMPVLCILLYGTMMSKGSKMSIRTGKIRKSLFIIFLLSQVYLNKLTTFLWSFLL